MLDAYVKAGYGAWPELLVANNTLGWYIGLPAAYEFDPTERLNVGLRSPVWRAATQARVVREMAGCLRQLGEGRVPK